MAAIYVFDSSALVDIKWKFPPDWTAQLLDLFAKMARDGRWTSAGQVLAELAEQEDTLLEWAQDHRDYFPVADEPTQEIVREILRRFPRLVVSDKEIPDADPFVVAEALKRVRAIREELFATTLEFTVVSQERIRADRPTIPSVCKHYDVPCTNLFGFLKNEGIGLNLR